MCANEITYPDFFFFEIGCWLMHVIPDKIDDSTGLPAYLEQMKTHPGFAEVWADDTKCMKMPFTPPFAWIGNENAAAQVQAEAAQE